MIVKVDDAINIFLYQYGNLKTKTSDIWDSMDFVDRMKSRFLKYTKYDFEVRMLSNLYNIFKKSCEAYKDDNISFEINETEKKYFLELQKRQKNIRPFHINYDKYFISLIWYDVLTEIEEVKKDYKKGSISIDSMCSIVSDNKDFEREIFYILHLNEIETSEKQLKKYRH